MDHGDLEAAPALAVLGGEVLGCAAVVALGKGMLWAVRGPPRSPEHCSVPWPTDPEAFRLSMPLLPGPQASRGPHPRPHLRGDPTPEIGVIGLRVQHWGHHGQPLLYEKPQRLVVRQNVVCICKLGAEGCHRPQACLGCRPQGFTEWDPSRLSETEWLPGSNGVP